MTQRLEESYYHYALSSGRFDVPGIGNTVLNVDATDELFRTGQRSQWGTMRVISNSVYAAPEVETLTCTKLTEFGEPENHAEITSKSFNYYDPTTTQSYQAVMSVTLTQVGANGQGGFKITRSSDSVVVVQTELLGVYAELHFTSGSCTISE